MENVHATCVELNKNGILLLGKSGAGKSDVALRLIRRENALLVADDRVDLTVFQNQIKATCPNNLEGLLEIRGIGICQMPFQKQTLIRLAVQLTEAAEVERLPQESSYIFEGVPVPLVRLNAFEASVTDKIVIKLKAVLDLK